MTRATISAAAIPHTIAESLIILRRRLRELLSPREGTCWANSRLQIETIRLAIAVNLRGLFGLRLPPNVSPFWMPGCNVMHTEATGLLGEKNEDEQDDFGGDVGLDDPAERYVCCEASASAEGSACRSGGEVASVF